jgi:phage FluMu protein Com
MVLSGALERVERKPAVKPCDDKKRLGGSADEKPFRCLCGSLLARLVPEGVELKCRRCKRQIVIPLAVEAGAGKSETM